MVSRYTLLILIMVVVTVLTTVRQLQTSPYTISASRSSQLNRQCTNTNRNSLFNKYGMNQSVQYSSDFTNFFSPDETLFDKFVNLDLTSVNAQLAANTLGYATYIVPAYILTALIIFIAPLLLICICCPMSCCLRSKLQYTKFERGWPTVVFMILGLTAIACSLAGIFSDYKIDNGYKQISCGSIIALDDALYGNLNYKNTSFFAGISTINTQLNILNQNLNTIYSNLTQVSSAGTYTSSALSLFNNALSNISIIPDTSTSNLTLLYYTPFVAATATSTISSTFPPLLGSMNYPQSLVGQAYSVTNDSKTVLQTVMTTADSFSSTSPYLSTNINQMIKDSDKSTSSLFQSLVTVQDLLVSSYYSSNIYYIQYLFYGIIIGLTAILLLSMTCFVCCDNMSCRHFIYFLGFLMFLVTLTVSATFLFLSYLSPIFHSGCTYLINSSQSPSIFATHLQKLGVDSTIAQQFSVCLSSQSGDVMSKLSGEQNSGYLLLLKNVISNLTKFDANTMFTNINNAYVPMQTKLSNYAKAQTLDITDITSINALKTISNPNNYVCGVDSFRFDSWIPSILQTDGAIPCRAPSGMSSADNSTCISSAQFTSSGNGCVGCLDTFSLLYQKTSAAQAYSYLSGRYVNCSTFNSDLSNIWQNYYLIKKNILETVITREGDASASLAKVKQAVTANVVPLFTNTVNQLYSSSKSILDPTYGMLAGLDCRVFGQDFILIQQTACHNSFSYSYFHRILTMIISFSLMFLLCCNTCIIFRKRKDILMYTDKPKGKARAHAIEHDPLSDARLQNYRL